MGELVQPVCEPSLLERANEPTQHDRKVQGVRDYIKKLWVAVLHDRYYIQAVAYGYGVAEIETPDKRYQPPEKIRILKTSVVENDLDANSTEKTDSKKDADLKGTDRWCSVEPWSRHEERNMASKTPAL